MNQIKQKLTIAFWIVIASFLLLTTATYAWMSIASTMKVTDLALNVVTDNELELAPDVNGASGEWTTILQMPEALVGNAVLKPVTYSSLQDGFLTPRYGLDGRPDFSDPLLIDLTQTGTSLPSSDEAEEGEGTGYLFAFDFWVRTGASDCTVHLSEPREVSQGLAGDGSYVIGKPAWNASAVRHDDGGSGAQNALRIAFRSYDESDGSKGKFVIFEPNADSGGGYAPTSSIDGAEALIDEKSLIIQSASGWSEQYPVLRDHVNYQIGDFMTENTGLFTLKAGHARHVTMYIWLEGQDKDCNNSISAANVLINIQFMAEAGAEDYSIMPR
ncbi:MAG: hypothetical protein EOM54_10570 [Clostridia bacterium]|nr:hypothetical protein [Clostridia bacterium]